MKVAIYTPYLDTFGGGERYMMTIAEILSQDNNTDVLLDLHLYNLGDDYLKNELSKRFNLDLSRVSFKKAPVGKGSNTLTRSFFLKKYDVLFYLTDGSIFYPTSKRNILHIQSPLVGEANSLWRKTKLNSWDLIIYNSRFTKDHSEKNWPIKSEIIYPPVDVDKIRPLKKKKYILSTGRFFGYLKDKKHEILIKIFKELFEAGKINGWSLCLVGSAGTGDMDYLEQLQILAKGLPVKFYPNLNYDSLIRLYGESTIYWHAAGFGESDPIKMEHFGISTVEAMAAGCIPAVINKGGQPEIVENGKDGFLWNTLTELRERTIQLINNEQPRLQLSKEAVLASQKFAKRRFAEKVINLIHK